MRNGQSAAGLLADFRLLPGPETLAISTVSEMEPEHGQIYQTIFRYARNAPQHHSRAVA